jgi:predicted CopG family antitoxin
MNKKYQGVHIPISIRVDQHEKLTKMKKYERERFEDVIDRLFEEAKK